MIKIKKFLQFYSLPLLSGILMGTSYIPFPPWAVFFCYIPLWLFALKQKRLRPILVGAWLCQFILTVVGNNWVAYTIMEFGFFPWPLAVLGLFVFSSFANLHIPLALFFWFVSQKKLKKHSLWVLVLLPMYFALSTEYYPMIFDWHFGYTWFYAKWPAAQTAEIWGFQFLNTLTLFFNLLFLYVFKNLKKSFPLMTKMEGINTKLLVHIKAALPSFILQNKKSFVVLAIWFLFFAGLNFYGQYLKNRWPQPDQTARILMVQPNTENLSKMYKKSKKDPRPFALSQLIKETEKYFSTNNLPPDFILWPEGTYPYRIRHDTKKAQDNFAQRLARKWQSSIILSATGESAKGSTNSVFVFNQEGKLVQAPYNKTILLAFGEYLPGEKWLPIDKLLPYYGGSFQRGTGENKVIHLNGMRLGFQICYEGLFDFLTRDLARKKAQILVNVTNDSWYGQWQQPWQHLYMTLARAIEIRRPIVRGTKTGFSAFISAKGEISGLSTLYEAGSWIQEVTYYHLEKDTIFTLWGYYINQYFLWILFFLFLGYFYLGRVQRKQ